MSFVLPAIAVGERYGLDSSWNHTKGQGLRILGATLLLFIPMMFIIISIVAYLMLIVLPDFQLRIDETATPEALIESISIQFKAYYHSNKEIFTIAQLIILALSYFPLASVISVLSIAFKGCTGWVPEQSEEKIDS